MAHTPPQFTVEHFFLALGLGEQFPPIGVQDSLEKRYPKPNWEGVAPNYEEQSVIQPFHHDFTSKAETTENPSGRKRKCISPDTKQTSILETNLDVQKDSNHWKKHRTNCQQWCPEWFDGWSDGF